MAPREDAEISPPGYRTIIPVFYFTALNIFENRIISGYDTIYISHKIARNAFIDKCYRFLYDIETESRKNCFYLIISSFHMVNILIDKYDPFVYIYQYIF